MNTNNPCLPSIAECLSNVHSEINWVRNGAIVLMMQQVLKGTVSGGQLSEIKSILCSATLGHADHLTRGFTLCALEAMKLDQQTKEALEERLESEEHSQIQKHIKKVLAKSMKR